MICPTCQKDKPRYSGQAVCKDCSKDKQYKWARDNKQRKNDINRKWRQKHSVRRKVMLAASNAMWRAIRNGSLKRGHTCAFCDSTQNIEAAHTDYGKPLEVIWLCRPCHRQWDAIHPKTKTL